mgnify:CR=1 FL=1
MSFLAACFVPTLQQTIYRTGVYRKALCQFFYANAFVVCFQNQFSSFIVQHSSHLLCLCYTSFCSKVKVLCCIIENCYNLLSPLGITLLYIAHATCESMFLYVGYLSTVSTSIEEAAYIDGASTFQIYSRVILPLMKPILSTVLIREGLAIYLNNYQSEYGVNYNEAFSCLILTCLPIIIFYVLMQKQIMGGLTSGAVKG